jgi:thiol-disulfide isomerase/thioredoxin
LRGSVVLVDFVTYTCINWLRSLPYLRAWAWKYRHNGLVVVAVHTPEFGFEHDLNNVRRVVRDLSIDYPVAVDNKYSIWNAFGNHYWPAVYFVDAQGQIRHHQFGEGEYEQSEGIIQHLLTESGVANVDRGLVSVVGRGVEAAADWANLQSLETYLGDERAENFASPGGAVVARHHVYTAPARLGLNHWALLGDWTIEREAARLNDSDGRIAYRFHARDLHLILGPAARDSFVRFRVTLDGRPPGAAQGADVDDQGNGMVTEHRLYHLIRQSGAIADRRFEIAFLDAGVEAFAFTFG